MLMYLIDKQNSVKISELVKRETSDFSPSKNKLYEERRANYRRTKAEVQGRSCSPMNRYFRSRQRLHNYRCPLSLLDETNPDPRARIPLIREPRTHRRK